MTYIIPYDKLKIGYWYVFHGHNIFPISAKKKKKTITEVGNSTPVIFVSVSVVPPRCFNSKKIEAIIIN